MVFSEYSISVGNQPLHRHLLLAYLQRRTPFVNRHCPPSATNLHRHNNNLETTYITAIQPDTHTHVHIIPHGLRWLGHLRITCLFVSFLFAVDLEIIATRDNQSCSTAVEGWSATPRIVVLQCRTHPTGSFGGRILVISVRGGRGYMYRGSTLGPQPHGRRTSRLTAALLFQFIRDCFERTFQRIQSRVRYVKSATICVLSHSVITPLRCLP
jgi:hypothetical protein